MGFIGELLVRLTLGAVGSSGRASHCSAERGGGGGPVM